MNALTEKLKNLAEFDPPAGGWAALQRRMDAQRRERRRYYSGFALAASLLLAIGVGVWLPHPPRTSETPQPAMQQVAAVSEVDSLKQQSRDLERSLAQVQPQVQVWDNRLANETAGLEKDLMLVDLQINHARAPDDARRLWRNRVALMSQLVQTHRQAALMPVAYVTQETAL